MQLIRLNSNWPGRGLGMKQAFLERMNLSEVRMVRSSQVCDKPSLKIAEQFQCNVPQCNTEKTLNIQSFREHNLIKRFYFQALRRHLI